MQIRSNFFKKKKARRTIGLTAIAIVAAPAVVLSAGLGFSPKFDWLHNTAAGSFLDRFIGPEVSTQASNGPTATPGQGKPILIVDPQLVSGTTLARSGPAHHQVNSTDNPQSPQIQLASFGRGMAEGGQWSGSFFSEPTGQQTVGWGNQTPNAWRTGQRGQVAGSSRIGSRHGSSARPAFASFGVPAGGGGGLSDGQSYFGPNPYSFADSGVPYNPLTAEKLNFVFDINPIPNVIPVPAALPLLGTALVMLGWFGRRRKEV